MLELIRDASQRARSADARTHRTAVSEHAGEHLAPAPRRHERRPRPGTPSPPRRSCTGARSSPDSTPESLASLAVAARPQRVSGGLDDTPRLDAHRRRRPAAGSARPASRATATAPASARGSRSPASRPTTTAPVCARRLRGAPRRPARAAGRARAGLFHQRMTAAQHRRHAATPCSRCTSPSRCRGTRRSCSTRPAATCASARRSGGPSRSARICARAGADGPGADSTLLLAAGRPGFGFETRPGARHPRRVERQPPRRSPSGSTTGEAFLAGGELLGAGRGHPRAGRIAADALGDRLVGRWAHRALAPLPRRVAARGRSIRGGRVRSRSTRGRPCTSTTPSSKLTALADAAAAVGVERFVLDDGWFTGRRDDTAGLGDWFVDDDVWPDGPAPPHRPRARARHGVRAVGRARDGQPRQRPRARASRLDPARADGAAAVGAAAAGARPRAPRGLRATSPGDCTRSSTSTRSPT